MSAFGGIVPKLAELIKENRVALLSSLLISLLFVFLLLYYTHGALLYGDDNFGYYSTTGALTILSPEGLIYAFSLSIAFQNYYAAQYIEIFVSSFLVLLPIYLLTRKLLKEHLVGKNVTALSISSQTLYLFNPVILSDLFTRSLLTNVRIDHAFFFFFLLGAVSLWKTRSSVNKSAVLLTGGALGLGLGGFPNSIRYLMVGILILSYFAAIRLFYLGTFRRSLLKKVAICVAVFFVGVLVFGFYSFWPLIQNSGNLAKITKVTSGLNANSTFYSGAFNTAFEVFRLLGGGHDFLLGFTPYHEIYFTNGPVILILTLWPLVLLLSLLVVRKKIVQSITLPLVVLTVILLFWSIGTNKPFGYVYDVIVGYIPFGVELIPPYFVAVNVLPLLYVLCISFSIAEVVRKVPAYIQTHNRAWLEVGLIAVFVFVLLIPMFPAFNGQLEGMFFNQTMKGYSIPADYNIIRSYLNNNATQSVLLLPATLQYIQTPWGYQGDNHFFNAFFYPNQIYTESDSRILTYTRFIPLGVYLNLTKVVFPSKLSQTALTYRYGVATSGYENLSINSQSITLMQTNNSGFQIKIPLESKIKLGGFKFLALKFDSSNETELYSILNNGNLTIGLNTTSGIEWYSVGDSCSTCFISDYGNGTVEVDLLLEGHTSSNSGFTRSLNNTVGIVLNFTNVSVESEFSLHYPKLYGINKFSINPDWLNEVQQENISYILFDKSFKYGTLQSKAYVQNELSYLLSQNMISNVNNGTYLSLYKINNS